ncbi:MAG TPA: sugar-binding protein [Spirochaetia bacterium]|nr:sugar-binding protein [Spirochaetia bacterium]
MNTPRKVVAMLATLFLLTAAFAWSQGQPITIAYVSNGPYTFWTYAHAGCLMAEQQFGIKVNFFKPPTATLEEQKRFIETQMAKGVSGLAISVIDPDNMTPFINEICRKIPVVMFDSDAPKSNRLAYIGMSNYAAGRLAGQKIKEQLPAGGQLVIFVGRLDAQNAVERRQGIIDELQGKPYAAQYPGKMTPQGRVDCGTWTILDTRTDGGDESRAKGNVEDILVKYPNLDLMIGLWSYNTPAIISAAQDAGVVGKVKIIGFDEEAVVLQGIKDGYVAGTIVQNPYEYGRTSSEILYKLITKKDAKIPANKLVDVPARFITKDNVGPFIDSLNKQLAVGQFFEVEVK